MKNKIKIIGLGVALLLLVGCGGGGDDSSPIGDHEPVEVKNTPTPTNTPSNTNSTNYSSTSSKKTRCVYPKRKSLYETSYVAYESSPKEVLEDCGFGTVCIADKFIQQGKPHCAKSIDNKESPYEKFGCSFKDWLRFPTKLEADCRCRHTGDSSGGAGGTGGFVFADPNDIDVENGAKPGGAIINCTQLGFQQKFDWPVEYGTGPHFNAWLKQSASTSTWRSGVFRNSTRDFFAVIKWGNPTYQSSGTIVAWNIDTKARRVVSGLYPDPRTGQKTFGSGYLSAPVKPHQKRQPLTGPAMMKWGPNKKMLYVYGGGTGEGSGSQRHIVKVDPDTGERTLVWEAMDKKRTGDISSKYGQCFRPDAFHPKTTTVGLVAQGFEVGPDGEFYLSMHDVKAGDGILKISSDGKICTPISVWGKAKGDVPGGGTKSVPPYTHIGSGKNDLQFPIHGLLYYEDPKNGPVIFGEHNSDLLSFRIDDGFRALESYDDTIYGGMGYSNMFFEERDGHRLVWSVGTIAAATGTIVDLDTGHRESVFGDSTDYKKPILKSVYGVAKAVSMGTMLSQGHYIGFGAFMIDPKDPNIAYFVLKSGGLGKMELSTFNNYTHSY